MAAKGISRLNQLRRHELIEELRAKQFEIQKLKKEVGKQSLRWQKYYSNVDWKKRVNYNKIIRDRYNEDEEYRERIKKRKRELYKLKKQEVKNGRR
jgi:hypothetical protein